MAESHGHSSGGETPAHSSIPELGEVVEDFTVGMFDLADKSGLGFVKSGTVSRGGGGGHGGGAGGGHAKY